MSFESATAYPNMTGFGNGTAYPKMPGFENGTVNPKVSFEHRNTLSENAGFGNGTAFPKNAVFGNGAAFPQNSGFRIGETAFPKRDHFDDGLYGWSEENFLEPKVAPNKPTEKKPGSDRPDPVNLFR